MSFVGTFSGVVSGDSEASTEVWASSATGRRSACFVSKTANRSAGSISKPPSSVFLAESAPAWMAVGAGGARMAPQDHFRMVEEVAVDRKRALAVFGGNGLGERVPGRAASLGSPFPLLQEQDVDHHVRACGGVHGALRQAHGSDQIGHGRDMLAGLGADLVHRPAARDEGGEAARPKPLNPAGDEIVVQRQAKAAC